MIYDAFVLYISDVVACPYLPTERTYRKQLSDAGFDVASFEDVTSEWAKYTQDRYELYCKTLERQNRVHGDELAEQLRTFYKTTSELFASGRLRGARITCFKSAARDPP